MIHSGAGFDVRAYSEKKKRLTVEIDGLLECTDGAPTSVWRAQPLAFHLLFAIATEAKKFVDETPVSLDACAIR